MKTSNKNSSLRQEWLARVLLVALIFIPLISEAAPSEDASLKAIGDKLRNMILLAINTAAIIVAVVMVAIKGLGYAMKDSTERSEEDMRKLKSGLIRIGVGTAIAMGAGNIGTFIVSSL
jgi:hypothetical protein